jgi:hypothetical protein
MIESTEDLAEAAERKLRCEDTADSRSSPTSARAKHIITPSSAWKFAKTEPSNRQWFWSAFNVISNGAPKAALQRPRRATASSGPLQPLVRRQGFEVGRQVWPQVEHWRRLVVAARNGQTSRSTGKKSIVSALARRLDASEATELEPHEGQAS